MPSRLPPPLRDYSKTDFFNGIGQEEQFRSRRLNVSDLGSLKRPSLEGAR